MKRMADDRSITGSAAPGAEVHDDDELADVLAAELERYATGAVPTVSPAPAPALRPRPFQPLAAPAIDARPDPEPPPAVGGLDPVSGRRSRPREDLDFARRAAEVERALRDSSPSASIPTTTDPTQSFRRDGQPTGRRSATGPVPRSMPMATPDDLPVKRRSGFRPPPSVADAPPIEPIDRVLPTGPVNLPEPTAALLDSMISDSAPSPTPARHAAPRIEPGPRPTPDPLRGTGQLDVPDPLYEDWEQSLRSIGRPRAPWEIDDEIVPTGGDVDLATVAIPVLPAGPTSLMLPVTAPILPPPVVPPPAALPTVGELVHRGSHSLPAAPPVDEPVPSARRGRTGRRRAAAPVDATPEPAAYEPAAYQPEARRPVGSPADADDADADGEGIDEVVVEYPVVSAATTGAIDLPTAPPKPRTAPVLIERVRTAILHLPAVPPSPTGSGAGAFVGRWFGAFASPLTLVLAFGLAAAGAGGGAAAAVVLGALLAAPSIARSAAWSATVRDDSVLQEVEVLGRGAGRAFAGVLLAARLAAAAGVVFGAGSLAGAWVDRTGALGATTASTAEVAGCVIVALGALVCAVLPTRATAVLVLLLALAGTVGTVLVALFLAPTGVDAPATTPSGAIAAGVAGFAAVGLLLVLCGPDVARWRTDHARPASSAVGAVVALVCGGLLLAAGTVLAARSGGAGVSSDEFAGALSDASASAFAAPLLVILLTSSLTLPALLLRSSGAAAARLLAAGRPVRLGTTASALLALAGALALTGGGIDPDRAVLAIAAGAGVPVAAWAGALMLRSTARSAATTVGVGVAVVAGWACCDGLVPGFASPVLDALGLAGSSGFRGGPAVGLLVALVLGVVAGSLARAGSGRREGTAASAPVTVEG